MKTLQCPLRTTRNNKEYDYADDNGGDLRKVWSHIQWNVLGQTAASGCEGPEDGDGVSSKTSENRHIPTRLCARENFIVFRRRESFKTYIRSLITDDQNYVTKLSLYSKSVGCGTAVSYKTPSWCLTNGLYSTSRRGFGRVLSCRYSIPQSSS